MQKNKEDTPINLKSSSGTDTPLPYNHVGNLGSHLLGNVAHSE